MKGLVFAAVGLLLCDWTAGGCPKPSWGKPLKVSYYADPSDGSPGSVPPAVPTPLTGTATDVQSLLDKPQPDPVGSTAASLDSIHVPPTVYEMKDSENATLAKKKYEKSFRATFNAKSNKGLVGGGRWRPKKNDCIPVCPKLKCFKWIKDAGSMNLDATLNIYFKDERFWCRIRTIIKNAVEQALGNRCTLCKRGYWRKRHH